MKKIFGLSFFVLGFSSLISQVVMIRELMSSFYGNEFFIGWVLFSWLLWTAIGSLIGERVFGNLLSIYRISMACHCLIALFFPATILFARSAKLILGTASGQIPNILPALGLAFFLVAPLCVILGLQFSVVSRNTIFRHDEVESGILVGKCYVMETLGFVAAGILFSYYFVFANEFTVAAVVALLNLTAMTGHLYGRTSLKRKVALGVIFLTMLFTAALWTQSSRINFKTAKLRFPTETLVTTANSVHGNIAVTRTRQQCNFYQNGLLAGAEDEQVFAEYLVHFALLAHPSPKKILLIGTGFNGPLREILKYDPDSVYYLEIDDEMVRIAHRNIPPYMDEFLGDRRVRIFYDDSRHFLKNSIDRFDVIIVNVPNPSTALLNRCYTDEFYGLLKTHLKPGGLVTTHLDFSPNYLTNELSNLTASVYHTLKKSFPSVMLLPEDNIFFVASPANGWAVTPQVMIERLASRQIENHFVVGPYIEYRLTNDRVKSVRSSLDRNYGARNNYDFQPRAYYYNLVHWLSYFNYPLSSRLAELGWVPFRIVFGSVLLMVVIPLVLFWSSSARKRAVCFTAMSVGGFSMMAAEVLVIYSFQIFYGNLYFKIAWIIACFMAGMGFGALWGTRRRHKFSILSLFYIHFWTAVYFILWLGFLKYGPQKVFWSDELTQTVFLALSVLIGGIIGFEFPIANKLYFRGEKNLHQKTGTIYAADLIGSCLGALMISVFLLPLYGITKTLVLLCALNLVASILFFLAKNLGRKYR
jgi:spermidine synthase